MFRVGSALHPAKMRGDPIMLVDKMQSRACPEGAGTQKNADTRTQGTQKGQAERRILSR